MTKSAALPHDDAAAQARHVAQAGNEARGSSNGSVADDGPRSRFGAAASILDSLDTRPLHMRLHRRPWWNFW